MTGILKAFGWALAGIAVVVTAFYAWAGWQAAARYDRQWAVHEASFAIPFPLGEGKRPDGRAISDFMPWKAYAKMSDTELRAIYAYLRTLPPTEKGER